MTTKLYIAPYSTEDWKEVSNVTFKEEIKVLNDINHNHWWKTLSQLKNLSFSCECKVEPDDMRRIMRALSPMQNLLNVARAGKRVIGKKLLFEMSYEMYRYIQYICHRDFGCNLKRFFDERHIKIKVKHKTKNGYWVWMK